jgi:hypothetical protein
MQEISSQAHKEDGGPWRIDDALEAARKEFTSSDNHISKNGLIIVNGEHLNSRASPTLFADVALSKTESSNEDNQGINITNVSNQHGMEIFFVWNLHSTSYAVILK